MPQNSVFSIPHNFTLSKKSESREYVVSSGILNNNIFFLQVVHLQGLVLRVFGEQKNWKLKWASTLLNLCLSREEKKI